MAVSLLSIPWRMNSMPSSATRIFTMFDLRWVIRPKRRPAFCHSSNAHPVADVETLDFDPLVVEDDAAVGHYAVDVGEDQADRLAKSSSAVD